MRILVTGASGRIGRAIAIRLLREHDVVGLDRVPSSTVDFVGNLADRELLVRAIDGVEAVVHTAALHAPHVGHSPDEEFHRINVRATATLADVAAFAGVRHFVYTSTTALYGAASQRAQEAAWIDDATVPEPRTIYHRSKLAAERTLAEYAGASIPSVTVLRMSRCFPEPAPIMAVYRLHRGVDARDVASAHACAIASARPGYESFVISGETCFTRDDREGLKVDAAAVLCHRAPRLAAEFRRRGWSLPASIDRVYSSERAATLLGWRSRYAFDEVLRQFDDESSEILPPRQRWTAAE
jgi:UDP-glucose 4-epimerase